MRVEEDKGRGEHAADEDAGGCLFWRCQDSYVSGNGASIATALDIFFYLVSEVGFTVHIVVRTMDSYDAIVQTEDTGNACTARPSAFEQPGVEPEHGAGPRISYCA